MACKPVCKLCDKLVISQSVTFAGGNLVVNLPAGSYNNGCKYCIVVAQAIPAETTINAPVVATIGTVDSLRPAHPHAVFYSSCYQRHRRQLQAAWECLPLPYQQPA